MNLTITPPVLARSVPAPLKESSVIQSPTEASQQHTFSRSDSGDSRVTRLDRYSEAGGFCHCDFNAFLMDMMARFANSKGDELEQEIQAAFRRLCEFLEIERAGLWRRSSQDKQSFALVQLYPASSRVREKLEPGADFNQNRTDSPSASPDVGACAQASFPWISTQMQCGRTIVFRALSELPAEAELDKQALARCGTRAAAVVPFCVDGQVLGATHFALSREGHPWPADLMNRLQFVTQILGNAMVRDLQEEKLKAALGEIKQLKERLEGESKCLAGEVKLNHTHGEIIGRSDVIRRVLRQVERVAPVDCAVLISGETGTGKELIARAIHRLSSRSERVMVMVNCAALPAPLVESELFGRERGAFTGALTTEVGRFEVADGSTIFLDEIGELSPEIQAKLLRVLQDGEFQRLGSPRTRKVKLRVIAATNRDLAKQVREGKFREDLYYRLRVFPIEVPPLRERAEDIPLLVAAFVKEFSTSMGKHITRISRSSFEALQSYPWPGNIRELRNIIEHGVILSSGETLSLPHLNDAGQTTEVPTSLAQVERDHILKTLEEAGWRVKGPYGAAKRLQVNPSTLYSRMAKLEIHRPMLRDGMPT